MNFQYERKTEKKTTEYKQDYLSLPRDVYDNLLKAYNMAMRERGNTGDVQELEEIILKGSRWIDINFKPTRMWDHVAEEMGNEKQSEFKCKVSGCNDIKIHAHIKYARVYTDGTMYCYVCENEMKNLHHHVEQDGKKMVQSLDIT